MFFKVEPTQFLLHNKSEIMYMIPLVVQVISSLMLYTLSLWKDLKVAASRRKSLQRAQPSHFLQEPSWMGLLGGSTVSFPLYLECVSKSLKFLFLLKLIGTPVTNRVLHVIYKINIWNQKKSFSIQAFKIEMDVYIYICMFVQLTPPRRSILAICLISQCVGMVPTWDHWPKKKFLGMTERRTKGSKY